MPLCISNDKMFVLWLIVHTLWNQLLLELSLYLFNTLQICYRHIEDVHEEIYFWLTDKVLNKAIFRQLYVVYNYTGGLLGAVVGGIGGILCSACPSFRDSESKKGFCFITLIAFVRFCSSLLHTLTVRQCTFDRKIGAERSVLQELWLFVIFTIGCLYYNW